MTAMKITFGGGASPEQREAFCRWWCRNGLAGQTSTGPVRVDLVRGTITFVRPVADSLPGDVDFPELRRDTDNEPLTEQRTVPMLVEPPIILWRRSALSESA